jgi:glucose/arabinose dehydrogenase
MAQITRRKILAGIAASTAFTTTLVRPARAAGMVVSAMVTDVQEPWALAFLPSGGILVTERGGKLLQFENDRRQEIAGLPQVYDSGQGGLLDLCLAQDFNRSRRLFLTLAAPQSRGGAGTALYSAVLPPGGTRLDGMHRLYEVAAGGRGGRHFGSRVVDMGDGTLVFTTGDRGQDDLAQDLGRAEGKILRIAYDGTVPPDNPFVNQADALPEIWSYGHRNPQGLARDAAGQLWASEHGARGGDEVNLVVKGTNYGWPVISYGRHYSGTRIGIGNAGPGMAQPQHYWDPSIAPSGHVVHTGKMFSQWKGHHLVGSLNSDHIAVLNPHSQGPGGWSQKRIALDETQRVRDLREAPDGAVWFASVHLGTVFRLARG